MRVGGKRVSRGRFFGDERVVPIVRTRTRNSIVHYIQLQSDKTNGGRGGGGKGGKGSHIYCGGAYIERGAARVPR